MVDICTVCFYVSLHFLSRYDIIEFGFSAAVQQRNYDKFLLLPEFTLDFDAHLKFKL